MLYVRYAPVCMKNTPILLCHRLITSYSTQSKSQMEVEPGGRVVSHMSREILEECRNVKRVRRGDTPVPNPRNALRQGHSNCRNCTLAPRLAGYTTYCGVSLEIMVQSILWGSGPKGQQGRQLRNKTIKLIRFVRKCEMVDPSGVLSGPGYVRELGHNTACLFLPGSPR
ncbi:hypothetical protein SODALDRAFT_133347 [Sodiomyces alkalinus F11]|uniref:Uncharacterized protein n=1 Tax=Sodiomyces alkalinus (strain CBS 110278 / VKM F-3762 / F11) TaxID=1314773 RepID=A0A3N2PYM1_SODAK|nr:hypothetical protein SODALDRAFT_133347 [Sodiomyces alkalinus F11]ROT39582.1 hypothetical protein SODALDRAFT_133347 [Sodiomyces alkalinus F11]